MEFRVESVRFDPDLGELKHYTESKDGDVGKYLLKRGYKLAALAKESVGKDTGELAASISVRFFPGPNPFVEVGSDVRHAYWVHEGTKPHEEIAIPGRMMRFRIGGRIVYAQKVHNPGTRAQKYLSRHLRKVIND